MPRACEIVNQQDSPYFLDLSPFAQFPVASKFAKAQ